MSAHMKKLLEALKEINPVKKDKTNPHFRNKYADINTMLEEVKPALLKHGLILLQPITEGCVCSQIIDGETGAILCESAIPLTSGLNPQQRGSEITYYRRYTLQSLLGLEAEDDDANGASAPVSTTSAPAKPVSAPAKADKPWINKTDAEWLKAVEFVKEHPDRVDAMLKRLREMYAVNKTMEAALKTEAGVNGKEAQP